MYSQMPEVVCSVGLVCNPIVLRGGLERSYPTQLFVVRNNSCLDVLRVMLVTDVPQLCISTYPFSHLCIDCYS